MIVKLKTTNGDWVFHEADEVFVQKGYHKREDHENTAARMYTDMEEGKVVDFQLRDNVRKCAFYAQGYLLNDKGDTINSL